MQLIGNFKEHIHPGWIDEILNSRGTGRPAEGKTPDSVEEEKEYQKASSAGYKSTDIYFYMFDKTNTSFNLELPFIEKKYHWWITKMLPGNFMPMHVDPHTLYQANSERYWMPWQDYQPGHIFLYQDQFISNYKMGDLYRYGDSSALHGAANIGHAPRIVLQISTYE
jgi:hypothetical protein